MITYIIRGVDQFGNNVEEEIEVPDDGTVVTTKTIFAGPPRGMEEVDGKEEDDYS